MSQPTSRYYEAQLGVLGSMLIDGKHTAGLVMQSLQAEDFTGPNRTVFEACRKLFQAAKPIDAVTVGHQLGPEYKQSLLDVITTAGDDAGSKPCYTEELYAKRVLEDPTVTDESYFVMVRELDEGDNPHNEALWAKANPCLRYPSAYSDILLKQIRDEHNAAYAANEPDKIRKFLTRRLCLWQVGSVNHYLDESCMRKARKAMVSRETFAALTNGLHCNCGFDLGKRIDLSGAAAVFDLPDGRLAVTMHGFMPENGAQRHEKTDRVPYLAWAAGGYCTLTPGDVTDNSYVYNWICQGEREHHWKVDEVDYDGHNATDLAIRMNEDRNREDFCVEVPQTCAGQNLAVKSFRELLMQDRIVLEESPLSLWCLQNAIEVQNNYGDLKLSKRHKDDTERIDPVAAAMNALARVMVKRNAKPDLAQVMRTRAYHL